MIHIKATHEPSLFIKRLTVFTLLLTQSWVFGQEQSADEPDTPKVVESADTLAAEADVPLPSGLEIGYKGFAWGSSMEILPHLEYMDTAAVGSDSITILMNGKLGPDPVNMDYHFSDGGFWKVEINYALNPNNVDEQIKVFNRIEKNLTEVYGPPKGTSQLLSGPSSTYADAMNVKYARAFYRSSWNMTPVKVELILSGLVQTPTAELQIIYDNPSILKLIYYNPDYMVVEQEESEPEKLPSIFDIY